MMSETTPAQSIDGMQETQLANQEVERDTPSLEEMRQREKELHAHLRQMGNLAKSLLSAGMLQACGYRVLLKPIVIKRTLEGVLAEEAPTLAEKGFEARTEKQAEKEERGDNHGIVVHIGPTAFDRLGGKEAWCDVGDVVVHTRYAGTRVEHPPGSRNFFQIVNDEDIFGKII